MYNKKINKIKSILLSFCLMLFSINTFAGTTIRSGEKFGSALTVSELEDCHGGANHLFSREHESFLFDKADARRSCPRKQLIDLGEAGVEAVTTIIGGAVGASAVCLATTPVCAVGVALYIGGIYWSQFKFISAAMDCDDSGESQEDRIRREVCEKLALKGIDCSQNLGREGR